MKKDAKRLGVKIVAFRNEKEWTQLDMAYQLGIGIATLSRWESGRVYPSRLALESLKRLGFKSE